MTNHPDNPKPKGITVEGFWRQLKDDTAKKQGGPDRMDSRDLSQSNLSESSLSQSNLPQSNLSVSYGDASYAIDDWLARFDEWLDRP